MQGYRLSARVHAPQEGLLTWSRQSEAGSPWSLRSGSGGSRPGTAIGAGLLLLLLQSLWVGELQTQTVSWSELDRLLAEGRVAEVTVSQDTLRGRLKEPLPDGRREVTAVRVDPALADRLRERGVTVTGTPPPGFLSQLLSWLAPLFLFYLVWTFAFRRIAERQGLGGLMSIGKSRAKVYVETDTKVTFADVAGVDEAKAELQEVVAFLQGPQGLRPPRRAACRRASCWSGRRAPARRCWPAP